MSKILIIDDNEEWSKEESEGLEKSGHEIVGIAKDGESGLEMFKTFSPDVVLLDLVMPGHDGYYFLDNVEKGKAKIIVLSALSRDTFIKKASAMGADYYLVKPCAISTLEKKIGEVLKPIKRTTVVIDKAIEERITNIFITVGIPAHIKGYQFLREAIKMAVDNPDVINSITKKLYPQVAERFDTSASKVERAIRHAIEVAWNRGKIENINNLFGIRVYSHNEKPTNGEFIALVADKMLLESV